MILKNHFETAPFCVSLEKRAEKQGLRKPLAGPISPKVKMKRSVLDSCRIIVPKTYYRKRPEMLQNL